MCVPSVPWKCPICPVTYPVCPVDVLPLELEFPHKSVQTSRVSLGRPEFIPGPLPGHSDHQIPLCEISLSAFFKQKCWEPPDAGLAPPGVWRVPPIPHCNWRTLPSSQAPSLPALSFPLPPTPLGPWLFLQGSGIGRPRLVGGERKGGGGGAQRHLGPDPHLGVFKIANTEPKVRTNSLKIANNRRWLLNNLNRDVFKLNHFVLIDVCSVDLLVACLTISTGFLRGFLRETHL